MGEIGLQQFLDCPRRVLGLEVAIDLLPQIGIWSEPAPGEQMIAFNGVLLPDRHFRGDQPDIADVVLCAGVMTAGEMDVERRVQLDLGFAPIADRGGVAFGIGGRKFAPGVSRAGDQAGAYMRGRYRQPKRFDGLEGEFDILILYARYQEVLPDRQAKLAVAEIVRDFGEAAHLLTGEFTHVERDADPVQTYLLLPMHTDMRHAVEGRTRRKS